MRRPDYYWCEFVVRSSVDGREWFLGGYRASSPRLALRWLRSRAHRVANALDPIPGRGPLPPESLHAVSIQSPNPGHIFRKWATDFAQQGWQMDALLHGLSVSITAGGPDRIVGLADTDVCFALTCRPILLGVVTAGRLSQTGSAAVIASRNWNALDLDRISPADASSPASEINALADYCDGPEQRCADHDSP